MDRYHLAELVSLRSAMLEAKPWRLGKLKSLCQIPCCAVREPNSPRINAANPRNSKVRTLNFGIAASGLVRRRELQV